MCLCLWHKRKCVKFMILQRVLWVSLILPIHDLFFKLSWEKLGEGCYILLRGGASCKYMIQDFHDAGDCVGSIISSFSLDIIKIILLNYLFPDKWSCIYPMEIGVLWTTQFHTLYFANSICFGRKVIKVNQKQVTI